MRIGTSNPREMAKSLCRLLIYKKEVKSCSSHEFVALQICLLSHIAKKSGFTVFNSFLAIFVVVC